jgi:hypothetical protein
MQTRAIIAVISFALAAPAHASTAAKVIASKTARGDYVAVTVTARDRHAGALYVRGYGRQLEATGAVTCIRGAAVSTKDWPNRRLIPGRLYRLPTPLVGGDCSVAVTGGARGSIRLQVLA